MSTVEKLQHIGEKYAIKMPVLMLVDLLDVIHEARLGTINDLNEHLKQEGKHE